MKRLKNGVLPGTLNLAALNSLTGAGRKRLAAEESGWLQISEIMTQALESLGGSL